MGLKALYYLSSQWPKLTHFVENDTWSIDNNLCENAIRPFVMGRRTANIYSLIETCKANGIEPDTCLVELFRQLPLAKTVEDFEALLPLQLKDLTNVRLCPKFNSVIYRALTVKRECIVLEVDINKAFNTRVSLQRQNSY